MIRSPVKILVPVLLFLSSVVFAYPNVERRIVSLASPPINFNFGSNPNGFALSSDNRFLIFSFSDSIKIVDTADWTLYAKQPPALSADNHTDGQILRLAYSATDNSVYASQDDGDILKIDLKDPSAAIQSFTLSAGSKLDLIAAGPNGDNQIYCIENSKKLLHIFDITAQKESRSVSLPALISGGTVKVNDIAVTGSEIYLSTDDGRLLYMSTSGTALTPLSINTAKPGILISIAATQDGKFIYVADQTAKTIVKVDTNNHALSGSSMDVSANGSPTQIGLGNVTNPTGEYGFVSGPKGLNIFDTSNDSVFDYGTDTTVDHEPLPMIEVPQQLLVSGDGMLYVATSTGKLAIVSENPFVNISAATMASGKTTLAEGDSATLTFQSDATGTFVVRAGGDNTGSGSVLKLSDGTTSGVVSAVDTDVSVTFNYSDNSSILQEGENRIFVFVSDTASTPDVGRDSVLLTVDNPPGVVTIQEVEFGNKKLHVILDRLTVSDIKDYNIYMDTDPNLVATKSSVGAAAVQSSTGNTVTGTVTGLENGTTYYIAVEAEDNSGNISPSRTITLADGSAATGIPEATVGPAGLSGEKGCSLFPGRGGRNKIMLFSFGLLLLGLLAKRKSLLMGMFLLVGLGFSTNVFASDKMISKPWGVEFQTGFWMPSNKNVESFFGKCCNLKFNLEGGWYYHNRYGVLVGAGFFNKGGTAVASSNGAPSGDTFNLMLIPFEVSGVFHGEFVPHQVIVPFVKGGVDAVYFHENDSGAITQGTKYGLHGAGGAQISLGFFDRMGEGFSNDSFKDVYLTLEAAYQKINNFGKSGLDLSGPVYSAGLLVEF